MSSREDGGALGITADTPPSPSSDLTQRKAAAMAAVASRLLLLADKAVASHRLMLPLHDNAYDRYRAVLSLDPTNLDAKRGVDNIVLAYVTMIRQHISSGAFSHAERLLARLGSAFDGNGLISGLQKELELAQESSERVDFVAVQTPEVREFQLPGRALSRKTKSVQRFLSEIAARVKETREAVIIEARSDAEGRWIYKVMKGAVSGYRIRGDIHLAKEPRVRLEAPLDEH